MLFHGRPNGILIDFKIVVGKNMAHANDFCPGNRRMFLLYFNGEFAGSFTDYLEMANNPRLHQFIIVK